jgi:hypothetical protein
MDHFKVSQAHNMVALLFDLLFEKNSLVGYFIGHAPTIQIINAYHVILASFQSYIIWGNTIIRKKQPMFRVAFRPFFRFSLFKNYLKSHSLFKNNFQIGHEKTFLAFLVESLSKTKKG